MKAVKHVIGVVTYIGENTSEERVNNVRKSLPTIQKLKTKDNFVFIWDNNSCGSHKSFLRENCGFVDAVFFSTKNLYDFASMHCISEIAKATCAEYITSVEDDMSVFNEDAIKECYSFLKDNNDCQHVKLIKFEIGRAHV